ncbi:GNAT family N-acetyltransferase [Paenibacillus marinisediminis]
MEALRIECKDVILREYRVEDLDDLHALTWQPEIYDYLPGWNVPKEIREDWLINYELKENQLFFNAVAADGNVEELRLRLGVVLKETGQFIGWCCSGMKEELPNPNREIMYAISKDHRGKGYGTQAAKGMVAYLFEHTNVKLLNAIALVTNMPSNRVIQHCGFQFHSRMEIDNESYNTYLLHKHEWEHHS